MTTRATRVVGKDHLQLTLDHGGATSEAIAFGFADEDPGAGARVDLVATAELDTFRGLTRTRLKVSKLARARLNRSPGRAGFVPRDGQPPSLG